MLRFRDGLNLSLILFATLSGAIAFAADGQQERVFDKEVSVRFRIQYLLSLPEDYAATDKTYPLLVFLHGSGESGTDLNKVKAHGPPRLIDAGTKFPFLVLSPQATRGWNVDALDQLIEDVASTHRVDRSRIYLTGLSMGGSGTWQLAAAFPDRFAAIAPICGGARGLDVGRIKQIPTWVFHGARDEAVPVARSRELVEAMKNAGAKEIKYTEYPTAGHDSWTETYDNPELYSWLLGHVRPAVPARPKTVAGAGPRLIVRGDDMGFSHSGNQALIKCFKEGIETSIEVIVPSPWFPEAVQMLAECPEVDVGIHLALSSEWDNVKWRPLTDSPSLRDPEGYLFPMIYPNSKYPGRSVKENNGKVEEIEKEFRAQIELGIRKIPRISHLSAHMGCDRLNPETQALSRRLAREYHLDVDPGELGVKNVGYVGPKGTFEEKLQSFIKMLDSLEPGKDYLFVDHPGFDSPELRAIHHIGYENVAADRQGVTSVWTDPRVKQAIVDRKIQLIGYKDLKR
jgi:predicted glycoside hydrolase/deacetylase ChbG (UPF0249 family)/poly(3-hydroxybutyrate) depolymerase